MLGCSSASSDCSMELRQLGSYHHALRRTVANRRRPTMPPPPPPSNLGLDDKINPLSSRCDSPSSDQQEEFHGFTDLDVSAASERAEILRDGGDLLKHDIAEARGAYKVGGNRIFSRSLGLRARREFLLRQLHCPVLCLSVLKL